MIDERLTKCITKFYYGLSITNTFRSYNPVFLSFFFLLSLLQSKFK